MEIVIDNYDVPLGRDGKYGSVTVAWSDLPMVSLVHLARYGARQCLNDAIAQPRAEGATDAELLAAARKRYAALKSGELRASRAATDPVDAMAAKMAKTEIGNRVRASKPYADIKPVKGVDRVLATLRRVSKHDDWTWDDFIDAFIAKHPEILDAARDAVNAMNGVAITGADLAAEFV